MLDNKQHVRLAECAGSVKEVYGTLPDILKKPLIKSPHGKYKFTRSGNRSAIYESGDGRNYRLKGCGNAEEGIVTLYGLIRGCQFEDGLKELNVTNELSKFFTSFFPNKPVGYYEYEPFNEKRVFCTIYETLGDLRLNDDFLVYMEDNNLGDRELYGKIGEWAGYIKRVIDDAGYIWGSYVDEDKVIHSNSHLNNIVVRLNGNRLELGPLDFDLAVEPKDYEDEVDCRERIGWQELERRTLRNSIFSSVAEIDLAKINPPLWGLFYSPPFKQSPNADFELRKMMVDGFDKGYRSKAQPEIIILEEDLVAKLI